VCFSLGFGIGTYWQSTLRALDTEKRVAVDAQAVSAGHVAGAKLAEKTNAIETEALKEIAHANDETDGISRDLAAGTVSLHVNATCPTSSEVAAGTGMADGAGAGHDTAPRQDRVALAGQRPVLSRTAEPDYLALRKALKRCPAKVAALQAILSEERRVGISQ
jgi:hypothetical protein